MYGLQVVKLLTSPTVFDRQTFINVEPNVFIKNEAWFEYKINVINEFSLIINTVISVIITSNSFSVMYS